MTRKLTTRTATERRFLERYRRQDINAQRDIDAWARAVADIRRASRLAQSQRKKRE